MTCLICLVSAVKLLWQSSKGVRVPFHKKLAQYHFLGNLYLILMFIVSHINLRLHLSKKLLLMQFILSVVLERMVRFLATVHVVLEEYNNCLRNKK